MIGVQRMHAPHGDSVSHLARARVQMYKFWTVVATDMNQEDARAYVRMNWRDMTPYSVAKTLRDTKYKDVSDADFEALWKRTTLTEFYQKKESFLEQEKVDIASAEEKEKQQKLDYEARMAADGEAVEAE